ncbi:hypothetical protein [Devosia chinhatensis]|uniref:Uncharacterized protein n=1 Tax=Devosia chinhatensis TaxID=429727 RepID=A0A0F5FEX9_9HYPH|nr:hypothetical protein [Devosia chinhatensis]KKB07353.1 hypothetical protein VE26_11245 [Devosia chinhatensis]
MTFAPLNQAKSRRFPHFPKRMFSDYAIFALMVAGGAIVGSMVLTLIVSQFRPIEASGWDLAQQLPNWFALGVGAPVGMREFWLYVTHGQTRRNFFGEACLWLIAFALLLGVLYAAGFWIEMPLYALMGWPQTVHTAGLYSHVLDVPMVLLESGLRCLLWGAAGLCLGAAFYRGTFIGLAAIGLCLFVAQIVSLSMGEDAGPVGSLVRVGALPAEPQLGPAVLAHLCGTAILLAVTWLAMRDAPILARK